jgi:hypothetical protein
MPVEKNPLTCGRVFHSCGWGIATPWQFEQVFSS